MHADAQGTSGVPVYNERVAIGLDIQSKKHALTIPTSNEDENSAYVSLHALVFLGATMKVISEHS